MNPIDALTHALAAVLAAAHTVLTALGAPSGGGATWLLAVAAVVVVVRVALVPFAVHAVRQAHAAARARPHLRELRTRYAGRRDADAVRARMEEQRRIHDEHGVSRWGCLPLLVQLPVWWTLYHLVSQVAGSGSVGAMSGDLVASFAAATVLGVPLVGRGTSAGAPRSSRSSPGSRSPPRRCRTPPSGSSCGPPRSWATCPRRWSRPSS
jgi:YidC/Oxa1 family membrane protein insertase